MDGNTLSRSVRGVCYMARRPRDGARWMRDRVVGGAPIDRGIPWFSYSSIDALQGLVREGMRVFEWGGGGSTVFLAMRGCRVVTAESSEQWAAHIRSRLGREAGEVRERVNISLIPAETRDPDHVRRYIGAVREGAPWDIILVDGLDEPYCSRVDCLNVLSADPDLLSPGGMVILDDAWRRAFRDVAALFPGFQHRVFQGVGPARWGVTRTDIYTRPRSSRPGTGPARDRGSLEDGAPRPTPSVVVLPPAARQRLARGRGT